MIKGCIEAGAMPDDQTHIDVTPVDYVASALVHISLQPENLNRVFQFPHPEDPRWKTVFAFLGEYGYDVRLMPSGEWMQHLLALIQSGAENALAPFAPVVANYQAYADQATLENREGVMKYVFFDDRNTRTAIEGSGIACPSLDARLLTVYFDHFVRTGFLPPPPREAGARAAGVGEAAAV
jgi:thioester reductase-like protein